MSEARTGHAAEAVSRRDFLKTLGAGTSLALLGAGVTNKFVLGQNPIKIGVVGPMTGWASVFGQRVVDGARLVLEDHDYSYQGRSIQKLITEDTKGQSDRTVEILDAFKNRDQVDAVIGPSLGNEGLAMADWAKNNQDVPILVGYSAPEDITMRDHSHNVLRPGWTGSQVIFHFGRYVSQELDYNKVIMVGQDYSYPWGQAAGFIRGFLENGGQEVKRIWHPVEQLDFGSMMGQLQGMSGDYDAVIYNGGGAQVVAFFKAWVQYGMKNFYPKLLGGANITDLTILSDLGPQAEDMQSSKHYVDTLGNQYNQEFRDDFYERYGRYPSAVALQGHDAMLAILRALEDVDGEIEATGDFIDALYDVELEESPSGPWYFDDFGNAVRNIYIRTVNEVDGELQNATLRTYPEVSQFGPYVGMEEEYMSQPAHARDYPPSNRDEFLQEVEKYFGEDYVQKLEENDGWWGEAVEYYEGEYTQ